MKKAHDIRLWNPKEHPGTYQVGIEMPSVPEDVINLTRFREGSNEGTKSAAWLAFNLGSFNGKTIVIGNSDMGSMVAAAILKSLNEERYVDPIVLEAVDRVTRLGPMIENELDENLAMLIGGITMMAGNPKVTLEERLENLQSCLDGTIDMDLVQSLADKRDQMYNAVMADVVSESVTARPVHVVFIKLKNDKDNPRVVHAGFHESRRVVCYTPSTGKIVIARYDRHVPDFDLKNIQRSLQERELLANVWNLENDRITSALSSVWDPTVIYHDISTGDLR